MASAQASDVSVPFDQQHSTEAVAAQQAGAERSRLLWERRGH
jgi:hypothetical protein